MAREVTVRLSADIANYLTAMGQAEQATTRVADAADRLGDIQVEADVSGATADLDQAASSADSAASSMEGAAGAAQGMSGGMDSAGAAAQEAAGGLESAGAASENVAASVGQVSAATQSVTADMLSVSAAAQDAGGGMESAGASALTFSSNLDGTGGSAQGFSAALSSVGAQSQAVAGSMSAVSGVAQQAASGMDSASASAQSASAGLGTASAAAQSSSAGLESAGAAAQVLSSNLDGSGSSAQSFSASLSSVGAQSQSAAGDMSALAGSAQQAGGGMGDASGSAQDFLGTAAGMRSEFNQLGTSLAVVGGGFSALTGYLISTGIEYNNLQQITTQALSAMTDSAADAADQMGRFDDFARQSAFFRNTWLEAQQQLMAFGLEAERVVPTLEGIEEAVAAIGGGDQEIRQLVDILGQIEGQGRITGRELQRMGQMGIDAADIMGTQLGMTGDEIREQITAGAIDAQTAIDALAAGMSERFEGSSDAIRQTFQGALNDVIAFTRDIGSIVAAPLVDPEGGGFLVDIMNMASDALLGLRELPDPLIQIAGLGATAAAGITLIGGAGAFAAPQIMRFWEGVTGAWGAVSEFATGGAGAAGAFRRIGIAAGVAAASMAALYVLNEINEHFSETAREVDEVARSLNQLALTGDHAGSAIDSFNMQIGGQTISAADNFGESIAQTDGWMMGLQNTLMRAVPLFGELAVQMGNDDVERFTEEVEAMDSAFSQMIGSGSVEQTISQTGELGQSMAEAGVSVDEMAGHFPEVVAALQEYAQANGLAIDETEAARWAFEGVEPAAVRAAGGVEALDEAIGNGGDSMANAGDAAFTFRDVLQEQAEAVSAAQEGLTDLTDAMRAYADVALESEATTDQWIADLQAINDVLDEGEMSLDRNTEAGRENREMLRELAGDTWDVAAAEAERTGSLESTNDVIDSNIEAMRNAGQQAGMTESEIDEMIRTYMGFNDVDPIEVQAENQAQEIFDEVESGLGSLPDDFEIWLEAQDQNVQDVINALMDEEYDIVADILGDSAEAEAVLQAFTDGDYEAIADIMGDSSGAELVMYDFMSGEYIAQVDINGNDVPAREAIAALMNGDYDIIADILGDDAQAQEVIEAFEEGDYEAVADILGDDVDAREVMNALEGGDYNATLNAYAETAEAVADLDSASRDRIAEVLADPNSTNAEGELNDTARRRIADILADSDTGLAESDLTDTARRRIADIIAHPESTNAEGELTSTARQRISEILASPSTWNAENELNNTARGRSSTIAGSASTQAAENALNNTARNRTAWITARARGLGAAGSALAQAAANRAGGGRADGSAMRASGLPSFSTGGRLPSTGLGTDSILGMSRSGTPTAWVDDREWIINQQASDKYDRALAMINADHPAVRHLSSYADGGRARSFEASQPQYIPVPQTSDNGSTGPSSFEGNLYLANGAFLGEVRGAMTDPSVTRAASQALQSQTQRDGRGTGARSR